MSLRSKSLLAALAIPALAGLMSGCDDSGSGSSSGTDTTASFLVASDLHFMSPSLMTDTSTADFKSYLAADRKMIVQSPALLHSFLDSVRAAMPRFVLLTGDLTKDGEKASHQALADSLATLRSLGIEVYVIPGNHDVYNPEAESYDASGATSVDYVTDAEFASIYHDCGYDQAIAKDTASLSYVVQLVDGVRLLALDPVRWRDNIGASSETVGGRFLPQTCAWIRTQLEKAKADGQVVVGAMHHGLVEHFTGQASNPISSDYVVAGYDSLQALFADEGLRVMFTGHFHANDIATATVDGNSLTDIETGSLVTAPSPFRRGRIEGSTLTVSTTLVREISQDVGGDFQTWAASYLYTGMSALSTYQLRYGFGVDSATATTLGPVIALAYAAHYAGDESITTSASQVVQLLAADTSSSSQFLAQSIQALYTDLAPADASGSFSLR